MKIKALYLNIILVFTAIYLAQLALILNLNSGVFSYTLDDPYIHMTLAKHIAGGHYGINAGEYAAPSSSILWPFLLAPFSGFGWFDYWPLIINYVCSLGIIYLFMQLFLLLFAEVNVKHKNMLAVLTTTCIVVVIDIAGLAFAGMEHSLQVYLSLLLVYGIIVSLREQRVPWWLVLAIIAGPLVRYENLALSIPAIIYLAAWRHWRAALGSFLTVGLAVGGFSVFLNSLGLGYLPSSIAAKSSVVISGKLLTLIYTFFSHLSFIPVCVFLVTALFLLVGHFFIAETADRYLAAIISTAIIAHMMFGYSGWYFRYDAYISCVTVMGLIYIFRDALTNFYNKLGGLSPAAYGLILVIICFGVGRIHIGNTTRTAIAANNIFEQQYQMHRFVQDYYQGPVAINDLGWVAYENPNYVLDLWGLASLEALNSRKTEISPAWMDRLAGKYNVKLAIIYDAGFKTKPLTWKPVAIMELGKEIITPADRYVTFYAVDSDSYEMIKRKLFEFKDSLPAGVKLTIR